MKLSTISITSSNLTSSETVTGKSAGLNILFDGDKITNAFRVSL